MNRLTIITGASSNHYAPLVNLLWTISQYEAANIVILDLGLKPEEREYLPMFVQHCRFRQFDFAKYPAHCDIQNEKGRMAFRAIALAEGIKEFGAPVMWLDAGCQLIRPITPHLNRYAINCCRQIGKISERILPAVAQKLNFDLSSNPPYLDPAACAFFHPEILEAWKAAVLDPSIAAPGGATDKNHNPDAVFSILLQLSKIKINILNPFIRTHCDFLGFDETRFRRRKFAGFQKVISFSADLNYRKIIKAHAQRIFARTK